MGCFGVGHMTPRELSMWTVIQKVKHGDGVFWFGEACVFMDWIGMQSRKAHKPTSLSWNLSQQSLSWNFKS